MEVAVEVKVDAEEDLAATAALAVKTNAMMEVSVEVKMEVEVD